MNASQVDISQLRVLSPGTKVHVINGKAFVVNQQTPVNTRTVLQNVPHQNQKEEQDEELSKMASGSVEESHSEEVFSQYLCRSVPAKYGAKVHPGNIVEAGSLAAQNLPVATYELGNSLPENVMKEGKLSDLQMEGVLFACQRHQMILPDGNRAGFFIADGTGVGKGRQIAGIILDNICRNRNKHIWFSISNDLRHDAQRDLEDIGCYTNVIDGCQQLDKETKGFGLVSEYREGILFSTYSTLVSSTNKDNKKSYRLDQLIRWCGGDTFDGCLIFDESHKAKHFVPGKEKSSSKVAVAVINIQRLLPKARVVYCSATGVTDVKNMAFMERLGLWGSGTTFPTFECFLDSLSKRGLGAMEMLSMEMKAAGIYVSRGLSYQEAEFQTVEASLTEKQVKIYDKSVEVWRELKRCLGVALTRTGTSNPKVWTHYWACHQRFFKQLCMSMKVPEIIKRSQEALESGHCVVIGLQTTGEASLDFELDQNDGNIKSFISLTKEILRRFILQYFPTEVHLPEEEVKADEWCVQAKCTFLEVVEKIKLPKSPLDELIDELGGPLCVAEMTGRKGFVGRYQKNERPSYIPRTSGKAGTESVSVKERNAFMNGDKLVAIISDAASTGISLHADIRAKNKRRRVHITVELPWSADKAVQQLGRSHRSNQCSGPIYQLVTSNLGGESRFAAAVAKRLQSLGAITKGDRRAATGADLTQFNFDTVYGRHSLKVMYEAINKGQLSPGVVYSEVTKNLQRDQPYTVFRFNDIMKECLLDMEVLSENTLSASVSERNLKDIGKFLNRILGLEVEKQNLIFSYFCQCLEATTEAAKREGRYNDGVTDLKGSSILMEGEPTVVFKEVNIGTSVSKHVVLLVDRGVPFSTAREKLKENLHSPDNGFYRSKKNQYGQKLYLLAIQKENSTHLFTVTRPNTGMSPFEEEKVDLFQKYDKIEPTEAQTGWTEQFENTKDNCIHGDKCKHKGNCKIGSRVSDVHLITGRILSILPALEIIVARFAYSLQIPRELRNLRVVRVELDNGERLVGVRYPHVLISNVEQYLKEQKENTGRSDSSMKEIIEPETSVNKKAQSKALSKPVNLHKFFKAKTNDGERTIIDGVNKKEILNSPNYMENGNSKPDDFVKLKTSHNTDQSDITVAKDEKGKIEEESKRKVNTVNFVDLEILESKDNSTNTPSGILSETVNIASDYKQTSERTNKKQTPITTTKNNTKTKSRKRNFDVANDLPCAKKKKQSNIFNMMVTANAKSKSHKKCPICQGDLEKLSNEEINKHIDTCVIE